MKRLTIFLLALVTSQVSHSIGNLGGYDCFGGIFKTPFQRVLDFIFARSAVVGNSENSDQKPSNSSNFGQVLNNNTVNTF